ncbi:hypothetical protein [Butyrivibrio sp. AE3003]|nr:hypothetical protein [Butyrivibrio sp. AE3003]
MTTDYRVASNEINAQIDEVQRIVKGYDKKGDGCRRIALLPRIL